jgi:glyoxylase-like metal-dependent hydrolase (beta-lactamase superfamily II)
MHTLPDGFHFFERGWLSSNSLLVHSDDQAVLFDSGYVTHSQQLLSLIHQSLGSKPLDDIVNTHLHSDHCGGNALLQAHFVDLKTHIPASQFSDVQSWTSSALTYELTGQTCPRFNPTHGLWPSSTLNFSGTHWQVFASPGHDNDALIFYEPDQKILISADALWENGMGVIFPEFLEGIGFENVAKTYDLIESLRPKLVIPGHGPLFSDSASALANARRKLDAYQTEPVKHAIYAAKVLIKFKLMELNSVNAEEFLRWCCISPLLIKLHQSYFYALNISSWIQDLLLELEHRKALCFSDQLILNL